LKIIPDGSTITVRDVQMVLLEMLKNITALLNRRDLAFFLSKEGDLNVHGSRWFISRDNNAI